MTETPDYLGYRFPPEVIARTVWLYHRFTLSFRDVEDLLAERGVTVSYETIRQWCPTSAVYDVSLDHLWTTRRRLVITLTGKIG